MAENDIYRADLHVMCNEWPSCFSLHYKQTSTDPTDDLSQWLVDALNDNLVSVLMDILGATAWLDHIRAWKLNAAGLPGQTNYSAEQGQELGAACPSNVAAVITLIQAALPAKHNGRIYVSGVPTLQTDGNVFLTAFLNGAIAAFATVIEAVISPTGQPTYTFEPQVYTNHTVPFASSDFKPITGCIARPQLYSQKARTAKFQATIV